MENSKLITRAVLNSLGVLIYVSFVSLFFNNAQQIFGAKDNKFFSPIAFLLLFIFSASLTGGLVLGKPILLYLDGAKKEGVKLFIYTGTSLFILLLLAFLVLFLVR